MTGRVLAVLVVLLLVALTLLGSVGGAGPGAGSASSFEDDGRAAALLLLRELGREAEIWRGTPAELAAGARPDDVLWLARVPEDPARLVLASRAEREDDGPEPPDASDPLEAARRAGDHAPHHYARFVERGGTLVLPASEAALSFLGDEMELPEAHELELGPLVVGELALRGPWDGALHVSWSGPVLRGVRSAGRRGAPAALVSGEGGEWLAARVPVGRGAVALVGSDGFLANDALPESDGALLLVRLVEELAGPHGRVLFDEYALGGWRPDGPLGVALGPRLRPFSLHVLALLAVALLAVVRPRPFPRDPAPLELVDPRARAEGIAALHVRAGRVDLLAGPLREAALRRLCARHRLPRRLALPDPGVGDDASDEPERWRRRVERVLDSVEAPPEERAAWREALVETAVRDRDDLARLARRLDRLGGVDAPAASA